MKYKPLFKIAIRHPYFDDARCPGIRVVVTELCKPRFHLYQLMQKDRTDEIVVLAPVDDAEAPLVPFPANESLVFDLVVERDDFQLFTSMEDFTSRSWPEYHNTSTTSGDLSLASSTKGGPITDEQRSAGVLARIRIGNVAEISPFAVFTLTLPVKSASWAYYVVTDVPAGATTGVIQIVDKDTTPSAVPLVFGPGQKRDLVASPDLDDPVAASLAARYPGLRRFRFVSDALVASSARGRKYLELQVDGVAAQEVLPNPSIRSFSRIAMGDAHADAWYCVIEHVKGSGAVPAV